MNYRSELAELTRFFSTVNSITNKYMTTYDKVLSGNPNIRMLKEYIENLFDSFSEGNVEFTVRRRTEILEIIKTSQYFSKYIENINTYYIKSYIINPSIKYSYDYDPTYYEVLSILAKELNLEIIDIFVNPAFPYVYPDPFNFLSAINLALNYDFIRSVLRPEDLKVINELWKIYFGDMK